MRNPITNLWRPLQKPGTHAELLFSTTALTLYDVVLVIVIFISRSFLHLFNGLSSPIQKVSSAAPNISLSMPLRLEQCTINAYILAAGDKARPGPDIHLNNTQLMLFLSAITEPAMLLLLAKKGCPIRPLGAVNVRNHFELLEPDLCHPENLLETTDALVSASITKAPRKVKRGLEFDIEVNLTLRKGKSGYNVTAFRQTMTILQFGKVDAVSEKTAKLAEQVREKASTVTMPIRMDPEDPSNWAAVCKDYNPIHISTMAARLFGFPGKIAHGNHVVAKAIDVLTRRSQQSADLLLDMDSPLWMEVEFRRPVVVPSALDFRVTQGMEKVFAGFEVSHQEKVCVVGTMGMI